MKDRLRFTLIELLVIISIIMMLFSLLMPALSSAKERSSRIVCASNLRQLGTIAIMYAGDHNGIAPTSCRYYINIWSPPTGWRLLNNLGYISDPHILYCPSDPTYTYKAQWPYRSSYEYGRCDPGNLVPSFARYDISKMANKAITHDRTWGTEPLPHRAAGWNVFFFDGHAKWVRSPIPVGSYAMRFDSYY